MTRLLVALICASVLGLRVAEAQVSTPMDAVAAYNWDQANSMAAQYADPVAAKVVTYYRLLTRDAASTTDIDAFMRTSPDWPQQALLETRWEQALTEEPDQATALAQCQTRWPMGAPALLRCAAVFTAANDTKDATEAARRAWTGTGITDPGQITAFLDQWATVLQPADEWARFAALARQSSPAAAAEIPRLAAADQPSAVVWVALNAGQPDAAAMITALPQPRQQDPGLFLAAARYLRKYSTDPDALAFWMSNGNAALAAGQTAQQHALWTEAARLTRGLITDGDAAHAYILAELIKPPAPADRGDEEFLAGFIALRLLHDPGKAIGHFQALASLSSAVITQSRAHYWLGRTLAAQGSTMQAAGEYTKAAAWPTTFYGQLAALALGETPAALNARILATPAPGWTTDQALDFAGREVARASAFLVAWGEPRRAYNFLMDLGPIAPDAPDMAMAGQLALGFQVTPAAVGIARYAGLHGQMLLAAGWPIPFQPPTSSPIEAAVTLALIRQESSFDVAAVSPVGALGLMQLMPATARLVAQKQGLSVSQGQLTSDPDANMALGTAYFASVLQHFDDCLPLAVAAYNAGPNRVDQWLQQNGDFRTPATAAAAPDVLDWIELIPFDETRNYVERVTEGVEIYRAKEGVTLAHPLQPWLH
ncbi:lytic transglycosylase domain-containing protein [Acidisoma cladoniae]|uniref:lytic transglycosylase domain-containing protein n=1 Tax=Acidisoma cladoniae TaxID=3040935 RepID=UPI00254FBF8C|nr:lytic transglycosylase domain-containing protein [Acidisoma sp. PAMC 29798]